MTRPVRTVKKIRINIDMHLETKVELEELKTKTRADSMSEVMRRALSLYKLVVDAQDEGLPVVLQIGEKKHDLFIL